MPLGKRMVACGLGVGDLAALAGISERQLSNYLAGRKCPSDTDLIYLSRVLKCRVEDITPPG
jgi:predicted transcriptional regulator